MTVDTSGAPVSGPIPSSTTRVAAVDHARLECELASGTGDRQEEEGGSPGCSPEDEGPRLQPLPAVPGRSAPQSPERGLSSRQLRAAGRGLDACAPPLPLWPGALSATYWGSARAARRGRGPGRGPASERLQRAGDPTREKARGAATTFQVRADRSSRRRAAQGGLGTWAPH